MVSVSINRQNSRWVFSEDRQTVVKLSVTKPIRVYSFWLWQLSLRLSPVSSELSTVCEEDLESRSFHCTYIHTFCWLRFFFENPARDFLKNRQVRTEGFGHCCGSHEHAETCVKAVGRHSLQSGGSTVEYCNFTNFRCMHALKFR